MNSKENKLSTLQLVLLATGGVIGSGWLFSPYYGFQTAGVWVLLSWLITAVITIIIAFSFAEVGSIMPVVGGITRFIGVTHNRSTAFIFLALGWLSYVVYLPLESESAVQYLGFWWHGLVVSRNDHVGLSHLGMLVTGAIILGLTWFNTLFIRKVARANTLICLWKIFIPLLIALGFIICYGSWGNVVVNFHMVKISPENIFLAITGSGLAFAFTGFQNGLILVNNASNKKRAIPYSLFIPVMIGFILYSLLSFAFISCTNVKQTGIITAVAPLLGLVTLFAVNIVYTILFIDAILAPLGAANVYTAATSRVLYGMSKNFWPKSILLKLNRYNAPVYCLWLNGLLGIFFLFPFPTWKELVNFLSSVVVFAYLTGPIALLVLRKSAPEINRPFKLKLHQVVGYLGFVCCSLLVYWSGLDNLAYLSLMIIFLVTAYNVWIKQNWLKIISHNFVIVLYILSMTLISYLRQQQLIDFPLDNLLVAGVSLIYCKLFSSYTLTISEIKTNLEKIQLEIQGNE